MRQIRVRRYVTPLREGGSLPAIVEGDDDGLYVLKFRGAGQGRKALIAELVAGELARALGLAIPDLVLAELDPELARTEGDPEIQHLIRASAGLNLALDYLPGSLAFDPIAWVPDGETASRIVWFDAYVANVDRTPRNTNLLVWHRRLWLIDHGAALYFHHDWTTAPTRAADRFTRIREHVLLPLADRVEQANDALLPLLTDARLNDIVAQIPAEWLDAEPAFESADAHRLAYFDLLRRRRDASAAFVDEAIRARL